MIYQSKEFMRRGIVVSSLAATVQTELDRIGQDWAWLSRQTNIAQSTFTKWKNEPDLIPDLGSLAIVASKLGTSLRPLIEACGFPVDDTAGYADRQARARALVAAVPRLAEVAEDLAKLKPDDQDSLMASIEGWIRDRDRLRRRRRKES